MHIDEETLALLALGEDVLDDDQRAHLAACPPCRRCADELERAAVGARPVPGAAADADDLVAPPPAVWERVHDELGLTTAPRTLGSEAAREAGADVVELAGRRRRRWVPALVAACTALVLGVTGGVLWERRSIEPAETTIASAELDALPGWDGAAGAAAVEEAADGTRQVVVSVDAPVPEGTYREVWLLAPDVSGLVSLGVLEGSEGRFDIPEGLDIAAFPVVDVSEEQFDGDPAHSGDSVVRGALDV
ncbi:anti-sigma factor [Isoptericola aurantiacus]|uniref:anti-sigma factor n=1 Tax=Isoptericola aurantiacus TaxID=3377839 RepID=UPI003839F1DF